MTIQDIIRAWKDQEYREGLTEEQRTSLPGNPIGEVLSQEELLAITGGMPPLTDCISFIDDPDVCSCWVTEPCTDGVC